MLEERILRDIQDLFVRVRYFAYSKNEAALKNELKIIEEKRALVNHFSKGFQKDILIYCFDNLAARIDKRQYGLLSDFANAAHNLPEIFVREYDLTRYWEKYIEPLREKQGKQLFMQFENNFKGANAHLLSLK